MSTNSKVPCRGGPEHEWDLLAVINELRDTPGNLVPVLQKAQDIYGYLPVEVQTIISDELGIPMEKVYGVSTFYSQFSLNPKGKYKIQVCLGTACYVKGAQQIIDKFADELQIGPGETSKDGLFTLDALRCIGACGIAPAVTINGTVYPKVTVDQVPEIIAKYRSQEA